MPTQVGLERGWKALPVAPGTIPSLSWQAWRRLLGPDRHLQLLAFAGGGGCLGLRLRPSSVLTIVGDT
jgi:hypothetical protein